MGREPARIEGQGELFAGLVDGTEEEQRDAIGAPAVEHGQDAEDVPEFAAAVEGQVVAEHPVATCCAWCGVEIVYSGAGRPRRYCSKNHRNRASELRTVEARIGRQVAAGLVRTDPVREVIRQVVEVERVVETVREARVPLEPATAREWQSVLQLLAGQVATGGLGVYDHARVYAAVAKVLVALNDAHPGGLKNLR
ncbi:hypothetical protein GCM10027589_04360 [Actinocorallia lasiicapitis]